MHRRQFAVLMAAIAGRVALAASPLGIFLKNAWAGAARRLLPARTELGSLIYEDPGQLDPRNLPITPIEKFDTMGLTEHRVDLSRWRLTVGGAVARPLVLDLDQIKALPAMERDVLLICPGAFAYYARWRGVSLMAILQQTGIAPRANHVDISGPSGDSDKLERFALDQVETEKIFLAYGVNGRLLPEKHGYPLRLVAQDHVGSQWIKFVDKIEAVIGKPAPMDRPGPDKSSGPAFFP